jgi:uncharacterized protein (DUF2252 family)
MTRIRSSGRAPALAPARARPSVTLPRDRFEVARAKHSKKNTQVPRDPKQAVKFADHFNQQLGLTGDDLKGKIALMKTDPLEFLRTLPALMVADLKGPFAQASQLGDRPAPTVMLAGDAHLGNFGSVRAPDGSLVYALNDYDQSGPGPAEWDLERLATSVVLQGRNQGLPDAQIDAIVKDLGKAYFGELGGFARSGVRPKGYMTQDQTSGPIAAQLHQDAGVTRADLVGKSTKAGKHGLHFTGKKFQPVDDKTAKKIGKAFEQYAQGLPAEASIANPPQILDIQQKLGSGGSSFNMARYVVLVADKDPSQPPHIVELKEEMPSAVADGSGDPSRADAAQDVANQHRLVGFLNPLVGSLSMNGSSFLVRETEPGAHSFDVTTLTDASGLDQVAINAATELARVHAQSMSASDARAWVGKDPGTMIGNLDAFAKTYADQTDADFQAFKKKH